MSALAAGIPVVSMDWVKKLPRSRNQVNDFLLNDAAGEKKFKFNLKKCYELTRKNGPIFANKKILASPSVKPSPTEIRTISECSEANFCETLAELSAEDDHVIVVADKVDQDFIQEAKKRNKKALIITGEGFMNSILHCKILTNREYKL